MNDLQKKIYDRLARYVAVETTSNSQSNTIPTPSEKCWPRK